ncbi:hypothetical protein CKO25_10675 [Thiocapsa imhoffii]|uniref:Uncharacterized protein n=1 Tax=Thiocapsa imhoffii TaxID=382777 RepID=A0A9X0WI14_9GAMM|nr:hypothetical protein [Thiocapsa imhoffii]MBK1645106.1 hypothetical protein [Thiocapsa imhoffii]
MQIAARAQGFARFAAVGLSVTLFGAAFLHIASVTHLLDASVLGGHWSPRGLPLPLVGVGGNAMAINLIAIGLLYRFGRTAPPPAPGRTAPAATRNRALPVVAGLEIASLPRHGGSRLVAVAFPDTGPDTSPTCGDGACRTPTLLYRVTTAPDGQETPTLILISTQDWFEIGSWSIGRFDLFAYGQRPDGVDAQIDSVEVYRCDQVCWPRCNSPPRPERDAEWSTRRATSAWRIEREDDAKTTLANGEAAAPVVGGVRRGGRPTTVLCSP